MGAGLRPGRDVPAGCAAAPALLPGTEAPAQGSLGLGRIVGVAAVGARLAVGLPRGPVRTSRAPLIAQPDQALEGDQIQVGWAGLGGLQMALEHLPARSYVNSKHWITELRNCSRSPASASAAGECA